MSQIEETLKQIGITAFGHTMPVMSSAWTTGALPSVNDASMSLTLSADSFQAPIAGAVHAVTGSSLDATLVTASGAIATGPGTVLRLYPQTYLRLQRLYALEFEDATGARPERAQGLPFRPVPRYFFFKGTAAANSGDVDAGDDLGITGELSVFDDDGMPIDPLATAACFWRLMNLHHLLQKRPLGDPFDSSAQLQQIAQLSGTPAVVRLRVSDFAGQPHDGSHLEGVTAVQASAGLFSLDASGGTGSDLSGQVSKEAATGDTGAFPDEEHRLFKFGPATTGRLTGAAMSFPQLPTGVTLERDFFSLRVVTLKTFLLGQPNPSFDGTKVEDPPTVRVHEPLTLLADGNDVLGAAEQALTGAATEQIAIGQDLSGTFAVPAQPGDNAHWPLFPAPVATAAPADPLPINLRDGFLPSAHYFDDGDPDVANIDVILQLNGLPAEATVRVYNRRFISDAREARGDGAGGIAAADGTLTLRFSDPLGLRQPGLPENAITIPTDATFRCDVVVLKRTGEARIYGNVSCPIDPAQTSGAPTSGTNTFATAARRAISNAGMLGLAKNQPALSGDPLDVILALSGEVNPRRAPRQPTMARRDLIVAGLAAATGGAWRSVLAGGRLTPESHSASPRLGSPGGLGGRETQVVGVATQNGRLAYDIARMGMRRATNLITRMAELAEDRWNEPAEPAELAIDAAPTATQGTFAGAVMQTIAPFCETPETYALQPLIDPDSTTRPQTFDELVDWVATNLIPDGIPFRSDLINQLNNLKDNDTLSESTLERLFNELERDIMATGWGRRDSQWSLREAITRARHFIYIESPGFAPTAKDYGADPTPPYVEDLLSTLSSQLNTASGLRVMICTPKHPDYGAGYEPFAAFEAEKRRESILALPTAQDPNPNASRVVAFHPVGFPGRPSRLESTVVIVDDVWAMIGSSTVRRRGLTFDGGSDVVFTDTDLVSGRSPTIANFRRQLMAARLGVPGSGFNGGIAQPDPNHVRLSDGQEAFYVIRERLIAGGLGKIERLWNGETQGVPTIDTSSVSIDLANPEGHEFSIAAALLISAIAGLNNF
ncbi:MAG: hypothetical protein Tsb0020_05080 [Haliangiales bacterium]